MSARRSRTPLIPIFTLLLSISSPATGSELDSILIRSAGGPEVAARICALKTISSYGTIEMSGQVGEYKEFIELPDKYRAEMTFGSMTITQGFDGQTAWMRDASGAVSELSGFEKRAIQVSLFLTGFGFSCPERFVARYQIVRPFVFDDGSLFLVDLVLDERDTAHVIIHSLYGHGYVDRVSFGVDNRICKQQIEYYKKVDGINFPGRLTQHIDPGDVSADVTNDSILVNQTLDASLFVIPHSLASLSATSSVMKEMVLPTISFSDHVFVPVIIEDREFWLLLDTGASGTILERALFGGDPRSIEMQLPALGLGGSERVDAVQIAKLCLGELCGSNLPVGVADLTSIAGIAPPEVHFGGLLGYDLLAGYAVGIRAADSQVVLHKSIDSLTPTQVALPFRYTMRVPTVRAKIGNDSADFILDTGSPFEIVLFEATAKRFEQQGVLTFTGGLTNSMTGIGGPVTYRKGDVSGFELGPYKSNTQPVAVTSAALGLAGSREIAGNIGLPWLMKFNPIVDYPNMRLILDTSAFRQGNSE